MTWTLNIYNVDSEKVAAITKTEADGTGFQIERFSAPVSDELDDVIDFLHTYETLEQGELSDRDPYESKGGLDIRNEFVDVSNFLGPKEHLEAVRDQPRTSRTLDEEPAVGSVELVNE